MIVRFKTFLQRDISWLVFYGDLVYQFKIIVGKANLSNQVKEPPCRLSIFVL